jgi:hypothetical protein
MPRSHSKLVFEIFEAFESHANEERAKFKSFFTSDRFGRVVCFSYFSRGISRDTSTAIKTKEIMRRDEKSNKDGYVLGDDRVYPNPSVQTFGEK